MKRKASLTPVQPTKKMRIDTSKTPLVDKIGKKKTGSFYGSNAAKTPKGAKTLPKTPAPKKEKPAPTKKVSNKTIQGTKRKASLSPVQVSKKMKVDNSKTPLVAKVGKKSAKNFYGASAAKTPKGAKVIAKTPKEVKIGKTLKAATVVSAKTPKRSSIKVL